MLVADTLKFNPPIQYSWIWFIIGTIMFLAIPIWYGVVFWITRRRAPDSLDGLGVLPVGSGLDRLKEKYLRLIEEYYQRYLRKEIGLRELHLNLSMLVRFFVFEAKNFPAPTLTLSDLKLAPYPELTKLIAKYYPEEFALITHGNAADSVQAAKGFIQQWV